MLLAFCKFNLGQKAFCDDIVKRNVINYARAKCNTDNQAFSEGLAKALKENYPWRCWLVVSFGQEVEHTYFNKMVESAWMITEKEYPDAKRSIFVAHKSNQECDAGELEHMRRNNRLSSCLDSMGDAYLQHFRSSVMANIQENCADIKALIELEYKKCDDDKLGFAGEFGRKTAFGYLRQEKEWTCNRNTVVYKTFGI